jgi:RNA polymerase sigma-70 factor (ECF subfamily)
VARRNPEALLASEQLRQCLEKTLAVLPIPQKMVIVLRDIEGRSMAEICNILGVQETNARVLLHRARTRLRAVIEAYERGQGC